MKISLKRTWAEIEAHLQWHPDPLAILRIVNLVSIRSWRFAFSFDCDNRTILRIEPSEPIRDSEVRGILSGIIPEVFCADTISLHTSTTSSSVDITSARLSGSANNHLEFTAAESADIRHLLISGYFGRNIPAVLQSRSSIESWVTENTRWGSSRKLYGASPTIGWSVMGKQLTLVPQSRLAIIESRSSVAFRRDVALSGGAGRARLITSPSLDRSVAFHADYGPISLAECLPAHTTLGRSKWAIEISHSGLQYDALGRIGPKEVCAQLLYEAAAAIKQLEISTEFTNYNQSVRDAEVEVAAQRLARRQTEARNSEYVFWDNKRLCRVPTCETELIMLYMKLETLGAIPFAEICVVEYTPRRGIDALVDYRRNAADHLRMLQPVEFEFAFENFFTHDHPEMQVDLVICWDFESDEGSIPDDARLEKVEPWLYRLHRRTYTFFVLRISKLAGLTLAPWR